MPATTALPGVARPPALFWITAAALSLLATTLFHLAPMVPYRLPFDEPIKVDFVLHGTQNFQHPILMLDIVRFANLFVGARDAEAVARLGRLIASLSGGLFVFSAIALARRAMGDAAALGAGVLTAVAPLTLVHAQLFKEDIFVAPWLLFGVLALDGLIRKQGVRQAVLFGIAAGLAAAAKYVGLVLLPLAALPPLGAETGLSRYYKLVGLAALVAVATFCAVNLPLFTNPQTFIGGVRSEVDHALTGHLIVLSAWDSKFVFTWTANLWPGLTAPLALAGLAGMGLVAATWLASPTVLRRLLIFAAAWYLMHELSPMKPYPEGARHMTVMAGVFAVFAAYAAEWLAAKAAPDARTAIVTAIVAAIAIVPARASYRIADSAFDDTQIAVKAIVAGLPQPSVWAKPTTSNPSREVTSASLLETPGFLVVNDLFAEQYLRAATLRGQTPAMRKRSAAYAILMSRPALLVSSSAGRFAYRNVPYRVIALGGDPQLLAVAAEQAPPGPDITLRFIPEANDGGVSGD